MEEIGFPKEDWDRLSLLATVANQEHTVSPCHAAVLFEEYTDTSRGLLICPLNGWLLKEFSCPVSSH